MALLLIGAGNLAASDTEERSEPFAVVEPSLYMEFSVNQWMRAALGGSYPWTRGLENFGGLSDADISGFGLELLLRFGPTERRES